MSNCKHCNKPIESKTGRRPKEYCNANCRVAYFKAKKPRESQRVNKSTHEAVLKEKEEIEKENAALKVLVAELRKNNPVLDRSDLDIVRMPPLSVEQEVALYNATHEDSKVIISTPTKQDEINKLEGELALLGKSPLANQRRKFLENKIQQLKYS